METDKAIIGALILLGLIVGANLLMYAAARGAARSNKKSFLEILGRSLTGPAQKPDDSMDELRRRIQGLEEGKMDDPRDSE